MVIDNQKVNKEVIVKPGDVVIIQGHKVNSLNLLHSGVLDVLFTEEDISNKNQEEIISSSLRICQLNGDFSFGEYSLVHSSPEVFTFRCAQEAKISSYPFSKEQILSLSKSNPNLSIYILKSLYRKIHLLTERVNYLNNILKDSLIFEDNLLILTGDIISKIPDSGSLMSFKTIINNSRNASVLFSKNKGAPISPSGDPFFLTADHSMFLDKDYAQFSSNLSEIIDIQMLNFFMNFLKIDSPILSAQFTNLPGLFPFPLENLALTMNILCQTVFEQTKQILECIERIAGANGLCGLWLSLPQNALTSSFLVHETVSNKIMERLNYFQNLENQFRVVPKQGVQTKVQTLFSRLSQTEKISVATGASQISEDARHKLQQLKDSVNKIVEYSRMSDEDKTLFFKALDLFKKQPDKLDVTPEARRARHQLTRAYWNLYYHCFLRYLENPSDLPLAVQLMFNYGFLDETMLSENNLLFLLSAHDNYSGDLEIYTTIQWLSKIASEEFSPSITEMGLTFEKHLQEEAKTKTYAEMQELTQNPENLRRYKINFEINQMITSCSRVCSESISTAFPILMDEILNLDINKAFLYKQQIEDILKEIISIDYQAFNREVLVKTKFKIEIVEKSILPVFIILPTVGSRIMMWQDLEGTNKRSKARFALPQFFLGDLRKNMILAVGRFRWEICKTQKGPQWADPIEGGLTGHYFDYISFYKKNPNLSDEAKEKIEEHIKNFRSNRERFAQDYLTYIEYESKGIAKLNKVLRDIFYRIIPFSKPVRDKLKTLPIYEPLENKLNNILTRRLKELDIKFRKYEKDPDGMPAEISEYIEMLKK